MTSLGEMLRTIMPTAVKALPRAGVLALVQSWLHQDETRDWLTAAWDPALIIRREDHGVQLEQDPETGETWHAHSYSVFTVVRGTEVGVRMSTHPTVEVGEGAWELAERSLRAKLTSVAVGGA